MASILFFAYTEKGQVNAELRIAAELKRKGHNVAYVGLEELQSYVTQNGFEYTSVFREHFPLGYFTRVEKELAQHTGLNYWKAARKAIRHLKDFNAYLLNGGDDELLSVIAAAKPDLMFFPGGGSLTELPALVAHNAGVKGMYFYAALAPCVNSGSPPIDSEIIPDGSLLSLARIGWAWLAGKVKSFLYARVARLFGIAQVDHEAAVQLAHKYRYRFELKASDKRHATIDLPELYVCPEAFDFPNSGVPGRYYTEASICLERKEPEFPWEFLTDGRPVVYCALGSLLWFTEEKYRAFFQSVVDASDVRPDWQWVIAIGDGLNRDKLERVPDNVLIVETAPQLKLLQRARLMITHGGTNTVKECIYFGVPMVVVPIFGDHFGNAARVLYHGLGVKCDLKNLTSTTLREAVHMVDRDYYVHSQMQMMQRRFRLLEEEKPALRVVEAMLGQTY